MPQVAELTRSQIKVYRVFTDALFKGNEITIRNVMATLDRDNNSLTQMTVRRALTKLVKLGFLDVHRSGTHGRGYQHHYKLHRR